MVEGSWASVKVVGDALGSLGVVYVAFGAPYLSMALVSMISLRVTNPDIPVCIITNVTERAPDHLPWWRDDDQWKFIDLGTEKNRTAKLQIYELSPFRETLFLDCDTLVLGSVAPLRDYLEFFDILLRPGDGPIKRKRIPLLDSRFRYTEHGHFNSGVIGFRRNLLAAEFFTTWQERFAALKSKYDQPSLVEAWFLSAAKVFPLPKVWNASDNWLHPRARNGIMIWHYKTRLERGLEQALSRAPSWFGATEQQVRDNDAYLALKRRQRHYRSPVWKIRAIVTNLRGGLFRRLERHPHAEQWLAYISHRPKEKALIDRSYREDFERFGYVKTL